MSDDNETIRSIRSQQWKQLTPEQQNSAIAQAVLQTIDIARNRRTKYKRKKEKRGKTNVSSHPDTSR